MRRVAPATLTGVSGRPMTASAVEMKLWTPGIETRRIKQISGASHFNEVYFTDVRIPDSQRLGAVGARPGAFNTVRYSEKILERHGISVTTIA